MDGEAGVERRPAPGPGPGWFPDPWDQAPYRWWDGVTWTGAVSAPPKPPLPRRVQWMSGLLAVGMVVFGAWVAVWLLIFPLLMLGDADNGAQFDQDARTWAVIFAVAVVDALICLAMFLWLRARPQLGVRSLIGPAVGTAAMVVALAVMPHFGAPVPSAATPGPGGHLHASQGAL